MEKIPVFTDFAKVRGEIDEQEYDRARCGTPAPYWKDREECMPYFL